MGGRGASSGIRYDKNGNAIKYGTEFTSLFEVGNIKFVKYNDTTSSKTPMETMTKGRIYVTVNNENKPKNITFYDENNKRYKQIDLFGTPEKIDGEYVIPHTHYGYWHKENGTKRPTTDEQKMIDRIMRIWYNKK